MQGSGGHDNLDALRGRIQARVDDAQGVLDEARADLAELPPSSTGQGSGWRRIRAEELTLRERDVLRLLAAGKSTMEIAGALVIAKATARNHCAAIMKKTGTHSRLEAVTAAQAAGLV